MEIKQIIKLTAEEIKILICKGLGLKPENILIKYHIGEDQNAWSGQRWDDGPLPLVLYGCIIKEKDE